MTDIPIVIHDRDWEAWVKKRTNAAYENVAVPGAYFSGKKLRLYTSASTLHAAIRDRQKWARMLLKHEKGHEWGVPNEDHPTTIYDKDGKDDRTGKKVGRIPMLTHAIKCGFDDRAGTRLLRFFWYKPTMDRYENWEDVVRLNLSQGNIRTYTAAEAEKAGY